MLVALEPALTSEGVPTDTELVEAARAGDSRAQEMLFRRYAPMVNNLAFRLMPREGLADDLVQDTFVKALTHLDRLNNPAAFAGWLKTIVVHTAHKRFRRARVAERLGLRRREEPDFERIASTSAPPEVRAELKRLYLALERFPSDERTVLLLHRVEGMSLPQISEHLGKSLSTVKRRLSGAQGRLERVTGESRHD